MQFWCGTPFMKRPAEAPAVARMVDEAGYDGMMALFGAASAAGCICALLLWWSAGRRRHELAASARAAA